MRYSCSTKTNTQAAAVATGCVVCLWNPSTEYTLEVSEVQCYFNISVGMGDFGLLIKQATVRGTPTNTTTPAIENNLERALAPISGVVLDRGPFTVEPTVSQETTNWYGPICGTGSFATPGAAYWAFKKPICVKPGTGLAIMADLPTANGWPQSRSTWIWRE